MKKLNKVGFSNIGWTSLILILLFVLASPVSTYSSDKDKNKKQPVLNKPLDDPFTTLIDVNNITAYVQQNGFHPNQVAQSWSTTFPKGTAGGIYQEGIVWGGKVNDGGTPTLRVGGNTYFNGTDAIDRIYRVRPDYQTADLTDDAANFFYYANYPLDASNVSSGDIDQLRAQYEKDWMEWPAADGAPYDDVDDNGVYDPNVDIPGIPGASQTLWIYYNDKTAPNAYGTPEIGLEVQETYWAYSIANPLGNVIFKKVQVVYKGKTDGSTPPNATIDDFYLVQWADPDVGQYTDDFAGCDPELNLGYAYSSSTQDAVYSGLGLAPPAIGYDFLQGTAYFTGNPDDSAIVNLKWRHGYKYNYDQPMTTFAYFAAGGAWGDPDGQDPLGTPQWYNLMRGLLPRPAYPEGSPFPQNVGGTPNGGVGTYLLSGDPVTGSGFVDGIAEGPGDRRILLVHGPINIALGDTAELVLAMLGGIGSTNTSSVSVLKFNDIFAQYAYDQLFDLPIFPSPIVTSAVLDQKVVLNWDFNSSDVELAAPKGYAFQGYNVYQFPTAAYNVNDAIRVATYDIVDGVTSILDDQFDEGSGLVLELPVQFGTDNGVKRYIEITNDLVRNQPLRNGQEYYFGVTAYGYNPNLEGNLPFKALESALVRLTVIPQQPTPGVTYETETGQEIEVTHASGLADGGPTVTVVDPSKVLGHNYETFWTDRQEIRDESGDWVPASTLLSVRRPNSPDTIVNASVDIAATYGPQAGTLQLNCSLSYDSPEGDWVDGVQLILPPGTVVLDAPNFTTGNDGSVYAGIIAPVVMGNVIMLGDSDRTGNGSFVGGEEWYFIIQGTDNDVPFNVDWVVYDDGYGGGPLDAAGTTQVTAVGNLNRLAKYWNLRDVTTDEIKLENRSDVNGMDLYPRRSDVPVELTTNAAAVVDGFQINMDIGYAAPTTILSMELNGANLRINRASADYQISDFSVSFGYPDGTAATSLPLYGGAGGTSVINDLQQDYELRWTGEVGDTTINGKTVVITKSGGSIATLFGASNYDFTIHPLNPTGTDDPFTIRIPFEVWNVDTGEQVNLLVYDRNAAGENDPTVDGFRVWNTEDRMYTWTVNTPYTGALIDPNAQEVADNATWNWVFFHTYFTTGDVININYANPIQIGVDTYTFSLPDATAYSTEQAKNDVNSINVFPNPYYGTQYRETTREGKYVTFSHLPARATIRIFDLAGVLVRSIEKNDPSQFIRWNLQNDSNYPVASGIYIVYIDMPELGTTKTLKLALIQEEQILRVY